MFLKKQYYISSININLVNVINHQLYKENSDTLRRPQKRLFSRIGY